MALRKLGLLLGVVLVIAVVVSSAASAAGSTATVQPQVISDASLQAKTTTIGGAKPLSTTRTVAHWFGSTLDPNNGVTYGYNMVGADPYNCSGSACAATVETDIIPLNVVVGGMQFNGTDVVGPTLASPQFAAERLRLHAVCHELEFRQRPGRRPLAARRRHPAAARGRDDEGPVQ